MTDKPLVIYRVNGKLHGYIFEDDSDVESVLEHCRLLGGTDIEITRTP